MSGATGSVGSTPTPITKFMAKPFRLPTWREKQIRSKFRRKDSVIRSAVVTMDFVMQKAAEGILRNYFTYGKFVEPSLHEMFAVSDQFYRDVVTEGFYAARDEKVKVAGKKRMAKLPMGLPRTFRDLEKVFRDRRYWPKVMKRSKKLTERLRAQYLEKLRKKFDEISPALKSGEISPEEAKTHLKSAWKTSKSRVEMIFRTETTNYFGKTQTAFFNGDPEIIGFLFDSVRDTSRSEICKSRHGLVYLPGTKELTENTPALHPNCRSHLIALANTPENRKLVEDPQRDPSRHTVAPLPNGWKK